MHIKISDSETGNNKGGSGALVHYLDKEQRLLDNLQPEHWFNGSRNQVSSTEVRRSLDNNIAKLSRDDAKFFLINISPSQKEIVFLKEQYGDDTQAQFKAYAAKVMDEYARNFNRPGIESNKDLLWFAKLENHRYYSHKDKEVKNGERKRGERKPGEQMHIQVIVSRKDISNKIKLSPMNKSRGRNVEHSKKLGQFDRAAFINSGEQLFDQTFGFDRKLEETFAYAKTQKNGNLKERMALREDKSKQQQQKDSSKGKAQTTNLSRETQIQQDHRDAGKTYLPEQQPTNYLAIALGKTGPEVAPSVSRKKKRRRTKDQAQDQEITL
ncbi:molybdopterin-guanine dinucleotide biosynthesis protein MobB [Mucilaginibacter sp. BJC16-A38]|uniref:DUF5712 family protein n=1 Tax=Mucilaginibacter phenanthrenivorans TaxID=1234842 RepID=UPI00215747CB|nr:DUF5712 family protein [Mucilaginibacter phenanthrenivorans]MCR8557002.1 molybdopterin-guanine dinucleotide biosynthesis protein MobB [Mucilaginibacter phenanthrenivorans]